MFAAPALPPWLPAQVSVELPSGKPGVRVQIPHHCLLHPPVATVSFFSFFLFCFLDSLALTS